MPLASKASILLVDDEPTNLRVLKQVLQQDYKLIYARSGQEAIELAQREQPDLILLDIMMPGMTGYEVCRTLKAHSTTLAIPIIFVTALQQERDEAHGFEVGAVDYITKPITPIVVQARVKNQLSLVRADELKRTRLQVVERLGRAAEYKDNETGLHVKRMSHYSQLIALAAGCCPHWSEELLHAAPMHDIGKIGIPDNILLKPGRLDDAEMAIMRQHAQIGATILGDDDSTLMTLAKSVALNHHEKWDGTGYPSGISGADIPLEARIVALADVFDALTSKRPYKEAWSVEQAMAHIKSQSGLHFDPGLVPLLEQQLTEILLIKARWQES
ncbi:response regulator [Rheinheimera salexigens]|uniref:Two-component system response regulator n=1 Tax=Rheinheimera salexigens TaxID=1628148 RepID=A0A1E7Q4R9_9GAMM|nr:HD domain-containing phosphohydrolase [Rheinheimera salexigens]OEY69110.1 two-component system response regulator [Rheinheimera salexigens]